MIKARCAWTMIANPMSRTSKSINRRAPRRVEKSRILIATEGSQTEVQYLEGLVQFLRASGVAVRSLHAKGVGRDPLRVVAAAIDLNRKDPDGFDAVWVLVDVDDHATLNASLELAINHSVPVVVSNPSFEIWLLWHYEDCRAYRHRDWIADRLKAFGHSNKSIPPRFPYQNHPEASVRACCNKVDHSFVGSNPSTCMPLLIENLRR